MQFVSFNIDILEVLLRFGEFKKREISKIFTSFDSKNFVQKTDNEFLLYTDESRTVCDEQTFKSFGKKSPFKIKKTRYEFKSGDVLEFYGAEFKNLATLNKNINELNLIFYGIDTDGFNTKFALEIYKKLPNLEICCPAALNTYDAFLIILNRFFIKFDFKNLNIFLENFRKFCALFELCGDLIEKNLYESLNKDLKITLKKLNEISEIDVFANFTQNEFLQDKLGLLSQKDKILELINNFNRTNFEFILNDEEHFFAQKSYEKNLKNFVLRILLNEISKILPNFESLNENSQNTYFIELCDEFYKIFVISEVFAFTLNLKKFTGISAKLGKNFIKFKNFSKWREMVKIYQNSGENLDKEYEKMTEKILKSKYKILDKKDKFCKISHNLLEILQDFNKGK